MIALSIRHFVHLRPTESCIFPFFFSIGVVHEHENSWDTMERLNTIRLQCAKTSLVKQQFTLSLMMLRTDVLCSILAGDCIMATPRPLIVSLPRFLNNLLWLTSVARRMVRNILRLHCSMLGMQSQISVLIMEMSRICDVVMLTARSKPKEICRDVAEGLNRASSR